MGRGEFVHLRGGGASLALDAQGVGLPRVLHWGADLGDGIDLAGVARAAAPPTPVATFDVPVALSLVPERAAGYAGRPGLTGSRNGADWSTSFRLESIQHTDATTVLVHARDPSAGLALTSDLQLAPSGVLKLRHVLHNESSTPFQLCELGCVLPVPQVADELLDLTGRWCRERQPQRRAFHQGTWLRQTRHGRTGHDTPLLLMAGTAGFGFRAGEVWGVHFGWSGNTSTWAERLPSGTSVLGAAELLEPGEIVLGPGEQYATPWLFAVWSNRGLDGLSAALHQWLRARPRHPPRPRPVVLNTWEAVYFDQNLEQLLELANVAARLGVERFVLDDGWFRNRRDDTAGLGDWYVDERRWPKGLGQLVDHVRSLGMQFGLWVEPEMVNTDSDLYRAHPDWVLAVPGRLPPSWRHQQVLDLANPQAYAYVLERLEALVSEYDIAFLKWDHNRDLTEASHAGRAGVHGQTAAVYRLLDELRSRHPQLEIESCSSGGGRIDLGILARADRVWASDTNDALERQTIQRWTQLLLPCELIGAHVGPHTAHTTGRTHSLSFRVVTALFGHFGIEWNIVRASREDQERLAAAISYYKRVRELLHTGEMVRADHPDPAAILHGVVAPDRSEALFAYVQMATSANERPGAARIPGLDPARVYRVEPVHLAGGPETQQVAPPAWYADGRVTLTGRALAAVGLEMPVLRPEQALLLHFART